MSFLKVYIVASTAATLLWIAYVAKSNFALEVRRLKFFSMLIIIENFKSNHGRLIRIFDSPKKKIIFLKNQAK